MFAQLGLPGGYSSGTSRGTGCCCGARGWPRGAHVACACCCPAQDEVGETCTTVIVLWEPATEAMPSGQVHFEAFQCSQLCVRVRGGGGAAS